MVCTAVHWKGQGKFWVGARTEVLRNWNCKIFEHADFWKQKPTGLPGQTAIREDRELLSSQEHPSVQIHTEQLPLKKP